MPVARNPGDVGEPDYGTEAYWERRYQAGIKWEWYFSFDDLRPLLELHFAPMEPLRLLEIGCGDAPLAPSFGAYDAPIFDVERAVAIDFSETVIRDLQAKDDAEMAGTEFLRMDARRMSFADGAFNAVIDKGTVDALISGKNGQEIVRELLTEAIRVLEPGGVLCVASHLNPLKELGEAFLADVLNPVLESHGSDTWVVRCHGSEADLERSEELEAEDAEADYLPVVFMIERRRRPRTRSRAPTEPKEGKRRRVGDDVGVPAEVTFRMEYH